jgi:hypothetical protein
MADRKNWEQFEIAVAQFVAALDPAAKVEHNVLLPDKDTGHLRQRDVWIEARVCQLFPIKVLISCKRWGKKLDEQDIDAFVGELRSSGAQKGVIYSFSGFTEPAIRKAKVLDICCCKLYDSRPPDIPESLFFSVYCCTPVFRIALLEQPDRAWGIKTFDDLFALRFSGDKEGITLIDQLATIYQEGEMEATSEMIDSRQFPKPWQVVVEFTTEEKEKPLTLKIAVEGNWKVYRGRLEAHLLKGSYSFTTGEFFGEQSLPMIDMRGPEPGPGWELVQNPPAKIELNSAVFALTEGHFREAAIRQLGPHRIEGLA